MDLLNTDYMRGTRADLVTITPEQLERVPDRQTARSIPSYRKGSIATATLNHVPGKPLTANAAAKLVERAEDLERDTKQPGRRNGSLTRAGVDIFRVLVMRFGRSGKAWPSYDTIRRLTGYCRRTICQALGRLKAAGLLDIVRRRKWHDVRRLSPATGRVETVRLWVQCSNLYMFRASPPVDVAGRAAAANAKPFPPRRADRLDAYLEQMLRRSLESPTTQICRCNNWESAVPI